jgi:hyperosmotically inducible periplasmic protein
VVDEADYLLQPAHPVAISRTAPGLQVFQRLLARRVQTLFSRVSPAEANPPLSWSQNMERFFALSFALALTVGTISAQEGILSRTGRALDNAGRGIRNAVETGVAQGQIDADEREVLNRVMRRVEWDKYLTGSAIQIVVQPGRVVTLRGSVASPVHKQRAADLVASTVGVGSVVDELAVVKAVKVIETKPAVRVIETPATVVEVKPSVTTETTVIPKP